VHGIQLSQGVQLQLRLGWESKVAEIKSLLQRKRGLRSQSLVFDEVLQLWQRESRGNNPSCASGLHASAVAASEDGHSFFIFFAFNY
jgi:hypothetical protein